MEKPAEADAKKGGWTDQWVALNSLTKWERDLNRGGKEKGEHFKEEIVVTGYAALEAVRLVEPGRWSAKSWGDCRQIFGRILMHLVGSLRGNKRYAEAIQVVGEASNCGWINPQTHAKLYLRAMQASMEGPVLNLPAARTARRKICTLDGPQTMILASHYGQTLCLHWRSWEESCDPKGGEEDQPNLWK